MEANNFDTLYSNILWQLHNSPDYTVLPGNDGDKERQSGYKELNGFQLKLTNIYNNKLTRNKNRKFNAKYAADFFQYVMTGDAEGVKKNPKAVEYLAEFGGRNTQYGPRIRNQLEPMLEELKGDKGSRRGTIMILEADDQEIFYAKRNGDTVIEYPCTNSLTFSIRDDKLNLVTNMRSQSAALVLPYDIYNWTNLMMEVKDMLLETYPNLTCGILTHQIASLHYFLDEEELVKNIIREYGSLV